MSNKTAAYDQGHAEGRNDYGDTRTCPYEDGPNTLDWLAGFRDAPSAPTT